MKVLVLNCGSSSLKYQLIDSQSEEVLAKGLCERIGIDGSLLTHQPAGRDKIKREVAMPEHTTAVRMVIDTLTAPEILTGNRCRGTSHGSRRRGLCSLCTTDGGGFKDGGEM